MRTKNLVCLFFISVTCWGAPESGKPMGKTLQDCFEAALQRSELVATQTELIKQAEENYYQLIGSVVPNIQGTGSYQFQQGVPPSFGTLYPNPSTSTKLTATQPLFQGFKEFAGLRQTKTLKSASEHDKRQAATTLYLNTATAFYTVVSYEQDIDNVIDEIAYYDKRIAELHQFIRIGRNQLTDVLTVESTKAALKASMLQIQGQMRAERAVLAFLTGFDPEVPLHRSMQSDEVTKPLEYYLSRIPVRPDVQGDLARAKASEEGIPIARAGHFPTINLQGDYYLERSGALSQVAWDVLFTVTLPIFSGGVVQSQIAQAVSKRDQADLTVSQTRRLAEQQIRQFYESYIGDKNQFAGYTEATVLAEKNYVAETKNFRLGLVTNLDVLTALTTFQESKRSMDKARFSMQQDIASLEAAAAFRPQVPSSKP